MKKIILFVISIFAFSFNVLAASDQTCTFSNGANGSLGGSAEAVTIYMKSSGY